VLDREGGARSDVSGNYKNQAGTVDDKISKVDATCTITGYSVPFDGSSHTATGSCLGVDGKALAGLDLTQTTHTAAGTYLADPWSFTDVSGNYKNQAGTVDDKITKVVVHVVAEDSTAQYSDSTPTLNWHFLNRLFPWIPLFFRYLTVNPKLLFALVPGSSSQPPPVVNPVPATTTVAAAVSSGAT